MISLIAKGNVQFSKAYYNGIKDLSAWDIEQAGMVARYAYNVGWLTKEEAIGYLQVLHKLASRNYNTWLDYFPGYLKGRIILYNEDIDDALSYIFCDR